MGDFSRVEKNHLRSSALDLFKEMKESRNIAPNIVTFNTLLEGMDQEWQRALALLLEIPKPNSFEAKLKKWPDKKYVWVFLGWWSEPLQRLSDLQISNKRVTFKHLVVVFFGSSCYEVVFCVRNIIEYVLHLENPPKKTRKNMQSTWLIKHFEIWCLMIIPIPRVQVPGSWVVVSNAFYFHHVHPEPWSFMILFDLGIFVQVGWFNDSTTD